MRPQTNAVATYLEGLHPDRSSLMKVLREVILKNLPEGYEERLDGGLINYVVPLSTYPTTYNGRPLCVAALASQKAFVTLYLMAVYGDRNTEAWFRAAYSQSGKKLDMGKSCVHFRSRQDVPLDVIGQAIAKVSVAEFVRIYENAQVGRNRKAARRG